MEAAVLLHDIRSAHNVGSIFRTADGAGVGKMYLSGYTPAPLDRFGRIRNDIAKTALGAERSLAWESVSDVAALIADLRTKGWIIVGVEQDPRSTGYRSFAAEKPVLFVFGNEVEGLPTHVREICDLLIEIPMGGTKESLNVAIAAGIILFAFRDS